MSGRSPIVSVVIPAYGVAPFIAEALDSVLAQTLTGWEAIVINDGSPDSPLLEAALAPYLDRIVYQVQENRGAGAARNAAIRMARGEWIAFLDGDDRWAPEFLERQLEFLRARELDFAWSDAWHFGEGVSPGSRFMALAPCRGPVTMMSLLNQSVNVITSGTVVRRQIVLDVGGFDESIQRAQDFDLWVRLLHAGARADYNPVPLAYYRVRLGSLSGDPVTRSERSVQVTRSLQGKLQLTGKDQLQLENHITFLQGRLALKLGKRHLARAEYGAAREQFRIAARQVRSLKLHAVRVLLWAFPGLIRRVYLARHRGDAL